MSDCQQLRINLVAYGLTPELVMVKVPNERGRWLLTHRCVIEVPCPYCGAITGEPCYSRRMSVPYYTIGTHCDRREIWKKSKTRNTPPPPAHKIRITAAEALEATQDPTP